MYGRSRKRHPKWAVCAAWAAGSGAWSFNLPKTAPTHRVPLWASARRGGERNVWQGKKYRSLVFFPLRISCFCLSGCSFEVFPWEQWSRAGRCCCPWCRNSQTWMRTQWRKVPFPFSVMSYGCCVALIQKTHSWCIAVGLDGVSYLLLCACTFCRNVFAMKNAQHACYAMSCGNPSPKQNKNDIQNLSGIFAPTTSRIPARSFRGKVTQDCRDPIYERLRASQCHLEPSWTPWQSRVVRRHSSSSCGQKPPTPWQTGGKWKEASAVHGAVLYLRRDLAYPPAVWALPFECKQYGCRMWGRHEKRLARHRRGWKVKNFSCGGLGSPGMFYRL